MLKHGVNHMGAPWFKMYASDLLADSRVRLLTDEQLGILVKLWCFCCQDGSIPSDLAIAKVLLGGCYSNDLAWVPQFFVVDPCDPSRMFSQRMRDEQEKYEQKCGKLRVNAAIGGKRKAQNRLANAVANALAKGVANPAEPEPEPESTSKSARRTKAKKPEPRKEGLKEILEWDGMDWSSVFFEIFKCFPPDRVINRITLAKQFRDAVRLDGATPEQIYQSALSLSKSREPRYMPDAARWMAEQGWRAYEVGDAAQV